MTYYRIDLRKVSFGELWRMTKLGFPGAALCKILRIPLNLRTAYGYPPTVIRLDEHELDQEGRRARLQQDFDLFEQAGLRYQFTYKIPVVSPESSFVAAAFLDQEGRVAGVVTDSVTRIGTSTRVVRQVTLGTRLRDGRVLVTSSRGNLNSAPNVAGEVVRGKTSRIIARHAERLGDELSGIHRIREDELDDYLEERERESADFQIRRGVWVPMSHKEVDKLRGSKPRGRGWQLRTQAVVWILASALGLGSVLGGVGSCASFFLAPEYEFEIGDVALSPLECASVEAPDRAVHTAPPVLSVLGVFPSLEAVRKPLEAARAMVDGESGGEGPRGHLIQLDRVLVYRQTEGERQAARPLYERWGETAENTWVVTDDLSGTPPPRLVVAWEPRTPAARRRGRSFESYLALGNNFALKPPWAPVAGGGPAVTGKQEEARRAVRRLQAAYRETLISERAGAPGILRTLWQQLTTDGGDFRETLAAQQEKRLDKLRHEAERLLEEDPTLDARALDLYVAWREENLRETLGNVEASDPFAEPPAEVSPEPGEGETLRQLQSRLGSFEESRDPETGSAVINDPAERYAIGWGFTERSGEELEGRFTVPDPGVAVPAVFAWLCGDGAAEVRYGFAEQTP